MAGEGVRVFALAGFLPCLPNWTQAAVQDEKERVIRMIKKLGGRFVESDEWEPSITHVVTLVMGAREGLSEKVMAGMAAGRWVVTKRYVEKSYKAGTWLNTESAYVALPREQVIACRERVKQQGDSGRLFHGMVAALVMEDSRRAGVYSRIVSAGGGKVVPAATPLELVASVPADLTHVFMDPWVGKRDPPGFAKLNNIEGLHLCDYKLLFHMVRGTPDTSESEWTLTGEKSKLEARERAKRAKGGLQRNMGKRPTEQNGRSSKRQRTQEVEVIDLGSDNEDNNAGLSSRSSNPQANNISIVDIDVDSEDDIKVLETKLETERKTRHGREYFDRDKAQGVRAAKYSDVCLQQRREVSRGSVNNHVDVISLSDEEDVQEVGWRKSKKEAEEVTILDSDDDDDEVMLVRDRKVGTYSNGEESSRRRFPSVSTLSRSPSPLGMQVEQDERGEVSSADEVDEVEKVGSRLLGKAPMIDLVDIDSTDDDEAVELEVRENITPPPPPPTISLKPFLLASEQTVTSTDKVDLTPSQISWLLPLPIHAKPAIKPMSQSRPLLKKPTTQLSKDNNRQHSQPTLIASQQKPMDSNHQQNELPSPSSMSKPSKDAEFPEPADLSPPRMGKHERANVTEVNEYPTVQSAAISGPVVLNESIEMSNSLDVGVPVKDGEGGEVEDNGSTGCSGVMEIGDSMEVDRGEMSEPRSLEVQRSIGGTEVMPQTGDNKIETSNVLMAEMETAESEELEISQLLNYSQETSNDASSHRVIWKSKKPSPKTSGVQPIVPSNKRPVEKTAQNVNKSIECLPSNFSAPKAAIWPRIVATLQKRFLATDEGIAISNINSRTARFDKHKEGTGEARYHQIPHGVEQDFACQLVTAKTSNEKKKERTNQRRGKAGKTSNQYVEPEEDGEVCPEDIETALKRLAIETSSDAHPSPALLHTVMIKLLLEARHSSIYSSAHSYLLHFLFLHAHRGRDPDTRKRWTHLILSAFRDISDEKLFRKFDISNMHDIHSCLQLWNKLFQRLFETIEQFDNDEERYQETEGSWLLLSFLTLLLQRDFEMWWKHGRGKGNKKFPLLFYLMGGRNKILPSAGASLLNLFRKGLVTPGRSRNLQEVRNLVAMVALLLSHLDSEDNCASLYRGSKLQLATQLATIIQEASLDSKGVFLELSLVQPPWLGVLTSRELLKRSCPSLKSILLDYINPALQLPELNATSKPLVIVMDIWAQRLLGVQKAGAIFRRNWTFMEEPERAFSAFTMLHKLEEEVNREMRSLKIEEVSVKMAHVTGSVNKLSEFANAKEQFTEDVEVGALRALLFKMKLPDVF